MRQSIPSNVWTILRDFPNQQVFQDSGCTRFVWLDDDGNMVLEKLQPAYLDHEPAWMIREYAASWTLKEN